MKKLIFVISQLYKGGAETALVNLLNQIDYSEYSVELLVLNQAPVEGAVSLIERVNRNVSVCNAYERAQKCGSIGKFHAKLFYTIEQREKYYTAALDFVRGKKYDWAFFWGEWCSPDFVAMEVNAEKKAAWIHSDISKAAYFDDKVYFSFFDHFDYFIFVSQHSMESSIKAYSFIREKAVTIYNINDVRFIKKQAEEEVHDIEKSNIPMLLTCANFRHEKNHLRQVEVLAELKRRNVDCIWVNIGSTADTALVDKVRQLCRKYQVEDRFLILGPKANPYKYIRMSDVVTVLSDHESWSMVITEAKILRKPVISTKTSGGLEQIVDRETGMLAEFDVMSIADAIEQYLKDDNLQNHIKKNITNFDNTAQILQSFNSLLNQKNEQKSDILYVIDDINYSGGAHVATKLQIKELINQKRNVTIYSTIVPELKVRQEMPGVRFVSLRDTESDRLYHRRFCACLLDKWLSMDEKKKKMRYTFYGYLKKLNYQKTVLGDLSEEFSQYPIVCVMSEASAYREIVANSRARRKIQWIHTDYVGWREHNEWTRNITENDEIVYEKYDYIVVLSEKIKTRFLAVYPQYESKLIINRNLLAVEEIKEKAKPLPVKNEKIVNFVTVGRLEQEKEYPRLIKVLKKLKEEGYRFTWTIVGGGSEYEGIKRMIQNSNLEREITLTGALDNPFRMMTEKDVFALLSSYEGLPNTIYEALILGIPVLATNVGGISDQIDDGKNGWLVENDADSIADGLRFLLMNQHEILSAKNNLKTYTYDNIDIKKINTTLLSLENEKVVEENKI